VLAYQQQVYGLAYHLMGDTGAAGDVTQETFIRAYGSLDRFRGGSFKSYLLRIASNLCYDELRRRQSHPNPSLEEMSEEQMAPHPALVNGNPLPEEMAERGEIVRAIRSGIQTLPAEQGTVLVLADVQGWSYQEIADGMGTSIGTVRSRLARARAKLRDYMQDQGELLPLEFRHDHEGS